ncbi:MAG: glycosyltransferase [Chloroflexi bacterium]|nr:glycosyltransferase [Chloroflexota bacterium]MCC6894942.1 glycosyltransferase [Anaerolineae bacterium]
MRILFISPYIPSLIRVRPYNILHTLVKRGHYVTLVALQPPGDEGEALPELRRWCEVVHVIPHARTQTLMNAALALPTGFPIQAAYSRSSAFASFARDLLGRSSFDVAHIEHLRGAVLAESLGDLPVVFDSVDSISLLFSKVLQDAPSLKSQLMAKLDLARTRRFEGQLTQRFKQVAVTSPADRQALVELGNDPERVKVVSNGVDLDYFNPLPTPREPQRLVFTGKMSYHANIAAAEDLVQKVMPLVWQKQPQTQLYIVGKDPSEAVQAFGQIPNVVVTGSVPDMRPYLASAAMSLSTVRYGVGVQNKVLEAMAMATPVVCSPQAVSALGVRQGEDVLVGDTPEAIANHIVDLLGAPEKRQRLGDNARRYVETYQTWDHSVSILEAMYTEAAQSGRSRSVNK